LDIIPRQVGQAVIFESLDNLGNRFSTAAIALRSIDWTLPLVFMFLALHFVAVAGHFAQRPFALMLLAVVVVIAP
jgi:hypothetical protein